MTMQLASILKRLVGAIALETFTKMPEISLERVDEGTGIPRLNVVFIHGLGGNATTSWCHEGGKNGGYFWLRGLAEDVLGTAVWSLGYPADKASWGTGWSVAEAATAVLDKLMSSREFRATGDAPIALICHSLGGIIAKKLVVTAHLDRGQQQKKGELLDRIAGIVFLATPHGGSILASFASRFLWLVSKTVGNLTASNDALLELSQTYRDRIANGEVNIRHRVYYEGVSLLGIGVVTPVSADPGIPGVRPIKVMRDHLRIHKPVGKDNVVYEGILAFLRDEVLQPRPLSESQKLDEIHSMLQVASQPVAAAEKRGLSHDVVLDLARRIRADVSDFGIAVAELSRAVELAANLIQSGSVASNLGAFVDEMLRRLAQATRENRYDDAAEDIDQALTKLGDQAARVNASQARLQREGLKVDILRRDPVSAARRLEALVLMEHPGDHARRFNALCEKQGEWFESGRDKGLNFELAVSIELARQAMANATTPDERGDAGNDLGNALAMLGERENGTERLKEAAAVFRAALEERTRERVPLQWAMTLSNLGNVLATLGERENGTERLEEAVTAYRAALEVSTREREPPQWAMICNNLGNALRALGERESGTVRLESAVTALRAALEERTRKRVPFDWATTHSNLGIALQVLGQRDNDNARLEAAVLSFRAALTVLTRENAPLYWASTLNNLGNTLMMIGERENGIARLEEAVAAFHSALKECTPERVPLDWAGTLGNQGIVLRIIAMRTKDVARAEQALKQIEMALSTVKAAGHARLTTSFSEHAELARTLIESLRGER